MASEPQKIKIGSQTFVLLPEDDYVRLSASAKSASGKASSQSKAQEIREFRNGHGLTETEFAKAVGTTQAQISRWEAGQPLRAASVEKVTKAMKSIRQSLGK